MRAIDGGQSEPCAGIGGPGHQWCTRCHRPDARTTLAAVRRTARELRKRVGSVAVSTVEEREQLARVLALLESVEREARLGARGKR